MYSKERDFVVLSGSNLKKSIADENKFLINCKSNRKIVQLSFVAL